MQGEIKSRKVRIVTGPVAELEDQLNGMLDDYNVIVWSFAPVGYAMHGTVVLLHNSVLMQQALAQPAVMRRN